MAKASFQAGFSFLSKFPIASTTLAIIPDSRNASQVDCPLFNSAKGKTTAFLESLSLTDDVKRSLTTAQKAGWGVFFMVNSGSGRTYGTNPNCRSAKNVTHFSAVFIDIDTPTPLEDVKSALLASSLPTPHFIVESSKDRFHVYWILNPEAVTAQSTRSWKGVQKALAAKFNSDPLIDTPRVLRLPGSFHLKDKSAPKVVTIRLDNSATPVYSLQTFVDALAADTAAPAPSMPKIELIRETVIPAGERHKRLLSEATRRFNRGDNREEVECYLSGFIARHFEDSDDYLPNGKEYTDYQRLIDSAESYVHSQLESATLDALAAQPSTESFGIELPAETYLSAPGIVGDITRHICSVAKYPIPSLTFAITAAFIGTLKASSAITEYRSSPANYFLGLAPTGSGKNFPQEVLLHTFEQLGLSRLTMSGIRSDKGILNFLEQSGGAGLLLLDEAKSFFSTLRDPTAPSYLKAARFQLTELYTATRKTINFGLTGNRREAAFVLRKPKLNFCAFAQPNLLESVFNSQHILEGFLPRFICFCTSKRTINALYDPKRGGLSLPGPIMDKLREMQVKAGMAFEETKAEAEPANAEPKEEVLYYTPQARVLYEEFQAEINGRYDAECEHGAGMEGLVSRAIEQVDRMSAALATERIDAEIVAFSVGIVRNQINAVLEHARQYVSASQSNLVADKILHTLQNLVVSAKGAVSRRDLQRRCRNVSSREFKEAISTLIELEQVNEISVKAASGQVQSMLLPAVY